jgi:hypothetical protein
MEDADRSSSTSLFADDSASSILTIEDAQLMPDGMIMLSKDSKVKIERENDENIASGADYGTGETGSLVALGNKKILAIHVKDASGLATASSASIMSDKIFGEGTDKHNLVSGFKTCSYNKLIFSPVTAQELGASLAAPGVYETTLSIDVNGIGYDIVREAITDKLNIDWPHINLPERSDQRLPDPTNTPFDHVMYCLPPGVIGPAAYAYTNGWLSVYSNGLCNLMLIQMHELGHNLGLSHAGQDGETNAYADQSGIMGSFPWLDDGPFRCFNAPNSWQLGWYKDRHAMVTPITSSWTGRIMGLVDYDSTAGYSVILKIATGGLKDYYLNFNRVAGMNSGTGEGGDKVMLTRQEGAYPSVTKLVSILGSEDTTLIENFAGSGQPIQIRVNEISLSSSPSYADVTVKFGCNADVQCGPGSSFACTINKCNLSTETCEETPAAGCNCDNICSSSTESAFSCPSDCGETSQLTTTTTAGVSDNGNMFEVLATNDVYVKGFEIYVKDPATNVSAFVYTKTGSYVPYENEKDAWLLVQSVTVISRGDAGLTKMPLMDEPLVIRAGSRQAFYITLEASRKLLYTRGNSSGALYHGDENLQFFQGVGKGYPFAATFSPRIWNGAINYATAPVLITTTALVTTKRDDNGNAGNLFDIMAKKDVGITGFDIHTRAQGKSLNGFVYRKTGSYVGSETDIAAWALIQTFTGVESQGEGNFTPLPRLLGSPIEISAGSREAFYITLTTGDMRYTTGNKVGALYAEDENLQFFEGAARAYPFDDTRTWSPRIWNGAISYDVLTLIQRQTPQPGTDTPIDPTADSPTTPAVNFRPMPISTPVSTPPPTPTPTKAPTHPPTLPSTSQPAPGPTKKTKTKRE